MLRGLLAGRRGVEQGVADLHFLDWSLPRAILQPYGSGSGKTSHPVQSNSWRLSYLNFQPCTHFFPKTVARG